MSKMTEPRRRFVDDVAQLFVAWGVPQAAARLYGYLLICDTPASLDRITADLEISKSSASVAARLLETYRLARRRGEAGSKRALYEVADNYEDMLNEQSRLLQTLADLLQAGRRVAAAKPTRDRLDEMAEFYLTTRQAIESTVRARRAKRSRSP